MHEPVLHCQSNELKQMQANGREKIAVSMGRTPSCLCSGSLFVTLKASPNSVLGSRSLGLNSALTLLAEQI